MPLNDLRPLGRTTLSVSPVCLGGNPFGWGADEEASFAVLDAYAEAGGNFVDTANIYSGWAPGNEGGESEAIIGRWLAARGVPDGFVIATKVGMAGGRMAKGLTRDHVMRGVEGSLERLGVDHIDLYYAHEEDAATGLDETLEAFDELVRDGVVGWLGVSNFTPARLALSLGVSRDLALPRFEVLQAFYNLVDRDRFEGDLEAVARDGGLAVLPFFSLARGFLTGKYRLEGPTPESVRAGGVVADYMNPRCFAVLEVVEEVAAAHDATAAQVALAWLLTRPGVVCPVASATTPEQVRELAGAPDLVLTEDEVAALTAVSAVEVAA